MSYQNNLEEGDNLLESSQAASITTSPFSKKIIALCAISVIALCLVAVFYKPLDMTPVTTSSLAVIPDYSTAVYKGKRYAVLNGGNANVKIKTGASYNYPTDCGGYRTIPDGWEWAPDTPDSRGAIAAYQWFSYALMTSNGCTYVTQYDPNQAGKVCVCEPLGQVNCLSIIGNTYSPKPQQSCAFALLLVEKPAPPTMSPTKQPTKQPTQEPIASPTQKPSKEPTKKPSNEPSSKPTQEPTQEPTMNPTQKPSKEPTQYPTHKPSKEPTQEPTQEPTMYPTVAQTKAPKDVDYCDFVFTKGKSDESISPGCALIGEKDLNFLTKGEVSAVIYACARENKSIVITPEMLAHAFITGISYAKSGEDAEIYYFSKKDNSGSMGTLKYEDIDNGSLVHKKYSGGKVANDQVLSLVAKSSLSGKIILPKDCKQDNFIIPF